MQDEELLHCRFILLASFSFLAGCALPLVSEAEIELQSEKEFEKMRPSTMISNDARVRSYIACIARRYRG